MPVKWIINITKKLIGQGALLGNSAGRGKMRINRPGSSGLWPVAGVEITVKV